MDLIENKRIFLILLGDYLCNNLLSEDFRKFNSSVPTMLSFLNHLFSHVDIRNVLYNGTKRIKIKSIQAQSNGVVVRLSESYATNQKFDSPDGQVSIMFHSVSVDKKNLIIPENQTPKALCCINILTGIYTVWAYWSPRSR